MSRAAKLVRSVAVLFALVQIGVLAFTLVRRFGYPYDLEWMEGGMLCHSLRLLDGQPIYAAPSVDFIPFLYTPLYPALLALLSKVVGLSYGLGRAVSIASFAGASYLAYRFAAREGGSRAAALAAMALPAAAYALTGSFYDLARPDSLWLFLVTAALVCVYHAARDEKGAPRSFSDGRMHLLAAAAGALLVLAFFTKQTAGPFFVAAGLGLLALNFRAVPAFVGALVVLGLPSLWWMNRGSGGWFWRYVFQMHQGHTFFAKRAWVEGPMALAAIDGPALLLVVWGLLRRRSAAMGYAAFLALVGVGTACLAAGTEWAITNAYIPGVFFPSLAMGMAGGRLCGGTAADPLPRLRPVVVYGLLLASLLVKLPGWHGERDDAFMYLSQARLVHRFDPRRFIPTSQDRAAGDALVARLRATAGEVLVPFHPFYARLAGKRTFVHQMGVMDVGRAGLGVPAGLSEAFAARRFELVVLDDKIEGKWPWWPGLQGAYEERERLRGPRVPTGAQTVPSYLWMPRPPAGEAHIDTEPQSTTP